VHQQDLEFAESALIDNFLRRFVDSSTMGVAFGLTVQRNGINTSRVDIIVDPSEGKGWGFCPSGDFIEISTNQLNLQLSDYSDGATNKICAIYTEENPIGFTAAHETSGVTRSTRSVRSYRIRVMTQTEFDALPAMEDDLSLDAQDRVMVIGNVLGNGLTVGVPNALVTTEVTQQSPFERILTATAPSTLTITGVEILEVSSTTAIGTSQLRHQILLGHFMRWHSPGDSFPASSTAITGDGEYTLFSNNAVDFIRIRVIFSLLPVALGIITDDYSITAIYENPAPRFSPADVWHRSLVGSTQPTAKNPHGLDPSDFATSIIDFPQLIRLGQSFLSTEAHALLARLTAGVSAAAGSERTLMMNFTRATGGNVRVYVTVAGSFELTFNASWDSSNWQKDTNGFNSSKYVFDDGLSAYHQNQATGPWGDTAWDNSILRVYGSEKIGELLLSASNDLLIPRLNVPRAPAAFGFNRTLLVSSNTIAGFDQPINIYLTSLGSDSLPELEIAINATWDGFNNWSKLVVGASPAKLSISGAGIRLLSNVTSATWNDSIGVGGWDKDLLRINNDGVDRIDGTLTVTQKVDAGSGQLSVGGGNYNLPRFSATVPLNTVGPPGNQRWLMHEYRDSVSNIGYRQYIYQDAITYYTEFATGCYFDGNVWHADNVGSGSVGLTRMGPENGVQHLTKTAPGAGVWNDGSWDNSAPDWAFTRHGAGSFLRDGRLQFSSPTTFSNPATSTGVSNTLMALNVPKAWGSITLLGGGAAVLNDAFNIDSYDATGPHLRLFFGSGGGMSSASYNVNISVATPFFHDAAPFNFTGTNNLTRGGPERILSSQIIILHAWAPASGGRANNFFDVHFAREDDDGVAEMSVADSGYIVGMEFDFVVFGRQS
jgi:hypothetical protein